MKHITEELNKKVSNKDENIKQVPTSSILAKKKWNLSIFKAISATGSISNIDLPKSTLSRYCSRLQKEGYIIKNGYGVWGLTETGSTFIRGSESDVELVEQIFHVHAYQVGIPILEDVKKIPEGWQLRKSEEKFNWNSWGTQINTKLGILDIEKTTKQFVVTLPRLFTETDDKAVRIKNSFMLQVIGLVKEWFPRIKIEAYDKNTKDFFILSHTIGRHVGLPNDPLAQLCINLGIKELKSKRLVIDNSPKNLKRLKYVYDHKINGELEGILPTLSAQDVNLIWQQYHHMVQGDFTKERIDRFEDLVGVKIDSFVSTISRFEGAMDHLEKNLGTHFDVLDGIKSAVIILSSEVGKLKQVPPEKEVPKQVPLLQKLKSALRSIEDLAIYKNFFRKLTSDEQLELNRFLLEQPWFAQGLRQSISSSTS